MFYKKNILLFFLLGFAFSLLEAAEQPVAEWNFQFHENLLWVQVRVGSSQSLRFILDSGCTDDVLDSDAAQRLNIRAGSPEQVVRRMDQTEKQGLTPPLSLEVGNIRFEGVQFLLVPLNHSTPDLQPMDGILGRPLFTRFRVQIDYQNSKIRLFNPSSPLALNHALELKLLQNEGLAGIRLADPENHSGDFVVDTGSSRGVIISPHAIKKFAAREGGTCCKIRAAGEIETTCCSDTCWKAGSLMIPNLQTFYCQSPVAGLLACRDWAGTVGNGFLSKFKVTFDFAEQKLFLEPPA